MAEGLAVAAGSGLGWADAVGLGGRDRLRPRADVQVYLGAAGLPACPRLFPAR